MYSSIRDGGGRISRAMTLALSPTQQRASLNTALSPYSMSIGLRLDGSLLTSYYIHSAKMISQLDFSRALYSCAALIVSHLLCSLYVMYMDLSGRWTQYSLHKKRVATLHDYVNGWKSFCADQLVLFLPFMTCCFAQSSMTIGHCDDSWCASLAKLCAGYTLGKLW